VEEVVEEGTERDAGKKARDSKNPAESEIAKETSFGG